MKIRNIVLRSLFLPALLVILVWELVATYLTENAESWLSTARHTKLRLFAWLNKNLPVGKV